MARLKHISATTDMQIAFIPHMRVSGYDDLVSLSEMHAESQSTGRVIIVDNHLSEFMLKYIEKAWQAGDEFRKLMDKA